jgi:hypothetical protein
LLMEGDLILESLIVTAAESFSERPSQRREDETALTRALTDRQRVEGAWRLAAHAVAARAADAQSDEGKWALECLGEYYPLAGDVQEELDIALRSVELGHGYVDTNLAWLVFTQLVGEERTGRMALFDAEDVEAVFMNQLLTIAWDRSEEKFLAEARAHRTDAQDA